MRRGKAPRPSAIKVDDYGMGQRCLTILQATWEGSLLVPKKGGHYGNHIQTSRGVQQGEINGRATSQSPHFLHRGGGD